jgi:hypothetical protein
MKNSPFIFGTTVLDDAFINRKDEILRLTTNLAGGINTTLISPRRYGKSSLVEKVVTGLMKSDKNIRVVIIDLFTVSTSEQFLEKFAREVIKSSSSKWQDWIKNTRTFFRVLIPKIHVGVDPTYDFSISFDWQEIKKHNDEILDLPETIAKQKKLKFIICLDEFQNISQYSGFEEFEKKLRSVWQRQKSVTYCIYGSRRHMMNDIFNNPSKPFYRFGDLINVDKIGADEWVAFITGSFMKTGKQINKKESKMIADLMQCHSWYVQQLAHYTWTLTEKAVTKAVMEKALNELINSNTPFYQKEIETLSSTQVNLLIAIASGEIMLTSAAVMNQYKLGTPRNVSKNKSLLVNKDLIQTSGKKMEFVDPAFELWFEKNYLNKALGKYFLD